jgi:chemotaxis methyl-accepting protein methylase
VEEQEFAFSAQDFERVRRLIYDHAGINLHANKHAMVYSRLSRRLRETGHRTFADYLGWLQSSGPDARDEWQQFVNGLTTNLTSFFRESHHFDSLTQDLRERNLRDARIWCSAASTGEEPYSIAMVVEETFGNASRAEIVASDIDTTVLATAQRAVYDADDKDGIEPALLLLEGIRVIQNEELGSVANGLHRRLSESIHGLGSGFACEGYRLQASNLMIRKLSNQLVEACITRFPCHLIQEGSRS